MNTFGWAEETLTDQEKDGQTNTHEDGTCLDGYYYYYYYSWW